MEERPIECLVEDMNLVIAALEKISQLKKKLKDAIGKRDGIIVEIEGKKAELVAADGEIRAIDAEIKALLPSPQVEPAPAPAKPRKGKKGTRPSGVTEKVMAKVTKDYQHIDVIAKAANVEKQQAVNSLAREKTKKKTVESDGNGNWRLVTKK